ncbi:MAG: ATP-binding protein [Planctomycetes bacterium]|jgi:serine/threonine-protein kinase RsbW|nr:ATP-binding protein [Planctomycetota bacterium]
MHRVLNVVKRIAIASNFEEAAKVQNAILDEVGKFGYSEPSVFAIKLAVEECLNNAIRHGNKMDESKTVRVEYETDASKVRIAVTDEGGGFDPLDVPDPTADENLEKPSGRGIMLMRVYMDSVEYSPDGSRVVMVKHNR